MSPLIPLAIAMIAALLAFGRMHRLARRRPPPRLAAPRRRALAEAIAAGLTVLLVGWISATALPPTPVYLGPLFAFLAIGTGLSQFRITLRERRR